MRCLLVDDNRTFLETARSILMKLRLPESDEMHRRVLAVLTFLGAR